MKTSTRNKYLLKRFGITEAQYEELYNRQNGCCAVCGKHSSKFKVRLAVDHDHGNSQAIRGLLCSRCNLRVVGKYRRGLNEHLLLKAYEYLTGEYTEWVVPPRIKKRKTRKCTGAKRLKKLHTVG